MQVRAAETADRDAHVQHAAGHVLHGERHGGSGGAGWDGGPGQGVSYGQGNIVA